MKAEIKSIKELEHQIALGTIELSVNIPKNIKMTSTTREILVGGKIHRTLRRAVELGGVIPRMEISKVASTILSSSFINHAEVLGLLVRLHPYAPQRGRKVSYEVTELGRRAVVALQLGAIHPVRGFVQIDIEINREAFLYHAVKKC